VQAATQPEYVCYGFIFLLRYLMMLFQKFKLYSTEWSSCGYNNTVCKLDVMAYLNVVV